MRCFSFLYWSVKSGSTRCETMLLWNTALPHHCWFSPPRLALILSRWPLPLTDTCSLHDCWPLVTPAHVCSIVHTHFKICPIARRCTPAATCPRLLVPDIYWPIYGDHQKHALHSRGWLPKCFCWSGSSLLMLSNIFICFTNYN